MNAHEPGAPGAPGAAVPMVLHTAPALDAFTALADHQSRTPVSFFDGPPVLYYHGTGARVYIARHLQDKVPWGSVDAPAPAPSADAPVMGENMLEQVVDVFVASDALTLFCPVAGCGVALPYPAIGLHAIKSAYTADDRRAPTIYMQLELPGSTADEADDEAEVVDLTIFPAPTSTRQSPAASAAAPPEAPSDVTVSPPPPQSDSEASRMFDAISACADLHPDRFGGDDEGDDADGHAAYPFIVRAGDGNGDNDDEDDAFVVEGDGDDYGDDDNGLERVDGFDGVFRGRGLASPVTDLPPPMPGSGGWITAENAHQFFDADGQWRGRGGAGLLGEGAGRVRPRNEVDAADGAVSGGPSEATVTATATAATATAEAPDTVNGDVDAESNKRPRME